MKLKVSYEKWENHFSQVLPVFAPGHLRGCHSEVSPWLTPVIHCSLEDRRSLPECDYIFWEPRGLHFANIGLYSH